MIPNGARLTWSPWPLRISAGRRSPGSTCRPGSRSASTGAGSRTSRAHAQDGRRSMARYGPQFGPYEMSEIVSRGLDDCLTESFGIAVDDCEGVFLSVDIDVCDPAHAPGTGTPEPGGLSAPPAAVRGPA